MSITFNQSACWNSQTTIPCPARGHHHRRLWKVLTGLSSLWTKFWILDDTAGSNDPSTWCVGWDTWTKTRGKQQLTLQTRKQLRTSIGNTHGNLDRIITGHKP